MQRCEALTKKKTQCSRNASGTSAISKKQLCTQHLNAETSVTGEKAPEPWTALKLPEPSSKNRKLIIAKIRRRLRNTKRDRGGKGTIYIYYIANESGLDYWKIGMTEKHVDERMAEWEEEHKSRVIKRAFYEVQHSVKFVERIIHLYLDYCRVHRTPTSDTKETLFRSVWASTGEIIDDEQNKKIKDDERLVAAHKHVEWFKAPILEIKEFVEPIVELGNT